MLVSTVTAMTSGGVRPSRCRGLVRRVARGLHHARPAGRVHVHHPHAERRRRRHRLRDGVGNVVELQVEEDAVAARVNARTMSGPSEVKSRLPILNPPATPRSVSASAIASAPALDVERDQELIHACSLFVVSRLPVSSAIRAMPCRAM